ncbi:MULTISPECIES: TlpA disulfide reductase family protein [Rhodanobacter]|uniref:TlpA disulfide reductase family protein n=1 Tax=Rhodanobacter TaxID=75309 RepID=UPI0004180879|nr:MULTISPECIES: TlpA disulfide reductase family protein [Rhodanobacter]KZC21633.1 redoxin [Rhodanobacter denitrificans]UJJ51225.1 TlpA family protein disulfide reductase [Rhodanobacter denitrificans]UJJ59989.1 TlpA family protein disulfide reductase [Rhodanobacter denitrificans]UJM93973.1 TlpA family protein disulfide reductase [Rhodanobacter denitrificans]UJM97502.1 TlpA family protein disulfide reductase [Rhodanobacter denitrificans]
MNIGPLALSSALLALLFGVVAALAVAGFLARRGYADAGNALYLALGVGLLTARIAYVVGWWPQYVQQPLSMLNIRDQGFDPIAGALGLLAAATLIGWRRPPLRRPLAAGVAVGIAAWAFAGLLAYKLTAASHPGLPALALRDLDGREVSLQTLRGQPSVINLWATWCGPCRREMPVLAEAQRTMPQIRFVFADQGESAAAVKQFMQVQRLALDDVLIDGNLDLSNHYNARGYPTTLFLDADGRLRDMHIGELSRATLAERLQRITPPAAAPR